MANASSDIHAGSLDSRVFIKTPVSYSIDLNGQNMPTYATASFWANANMTKGSESGINGLYVVSNFYTFVYRKNDFPLNEGSIITFDSLQYNVRSISNQNQRQPYMSIVAERVV